MSVEDSQSVVQVNQKLAPTTALFSSKLKATASPVGGLGHSQACMKPVATADSQTSPECPVMP